MQTLSQGSLNFLYQKIYFPTILLPSHLNITKFMVSSFCSECSNVKPHGKLIKLILYIKMQTPTMAFLIVCYDTLFVSRFKRKEIRLMSVRVHYHRPISIDTFLLK